MKSEELNGELKEINSQHAMDLLESWLKNATIMPSYDTVIKEFVYRLDGKYIIQTYTFRYLLCKAYHLTEN
jgi:hypothetical protein